MNSFRTQLITLIAEHLKMNPEQVASANDLTELGIDSLGVIDMITLLEDHFGIRIPNDKLDSVNSVEDLVLAMESMVSNHA